MILGLAQVFQGSPLFLSRVHTGGIMRAYMQEHYRFIFSFFKIFDHSFKIETIGSRIEIGVFNKIHIQFLNDLFVDRPGRVRHTNGFLRVIFLYKFEA